jgi:hypothetical protein
MFCDTHSTTELHQCSQQTTPHTPLTVQVQNIPKHNQPIRHNIRNPHVHRLQRKVFEKILQHHHGDAARQPAGHEGKAQEQHQPRLPRHPAAGVGEGVGRQARLLDRVDDEHAERGADDGDPVDEGDVFEGAIEGRVRVGGGVDEDEEAEGELDAEH